MHNFVSVADSGHFGTDLHADPDPRNRTSNYCIRMRIREAQNGSGTLLAAE
jgi:hypothetical protein